MFGQVWSWAGKTRKLDLNLGVPWPQVEAKLFDLFQTIPYWKSMPMLEQAARIHYGLWPFIPSRTGMAAGPGYWPTSGFDCTTCQ